MVLTNCTPKKAEENTTAKEEEKSFVSSEKTPSTEQQQQPTVKTTEKTPASSDGEFFDNYVTKKGKQCGIYTVKDGDNVWVIAEKYAAYLYGSNYTKKDVGAIAVKINRLNYENLFGGVNDELKVGDKVYIEIMDKR